MNININNKYLYLNNNNRFQILNNNIRNQNKFNAKIILIKLNNS